MIQLVDVRTVADSPLTSARTVPDGAAPPPGTDAGRLRHRAPLDAGRRIRRRTVLFN
jgi:hypothetical protein